MILQYFLDHIKITGPYLNKKQGRRFCTYTNTITNKITQKTYAKYLMEMHLKREISKEETIDHIDRDKLNDTLNNFRIVSSSQHVSEDNRKVIPINFICPICEASFVRSARITRSRHKNNQAGPFCSASCRGKYGKQVQETGIKLPVQDDIKSEYYYSEKDATPTD